MRGATFGDALVRKTTHHFTSSLLRNDVSRVALHPPFKGFRCCDEDGANRTALSCVLLCPSDAAWLPTSPVWTDSQCPSWPGSQPGEPVSWRVPPRHSDGSTYLCAASGGLWKSGTTNLHAVVHDGIGAMCASRLLSRCNVSSILPSGVLSWVDEMHGAALQHVSAATASQKPASFAWLWWHGKGYAHEARWAAGVAMIFMVRDPREAVVSLWEFELFPTTRPEPNATLSCGYAVSHAATAVELISTAAHRLHDGNSTLLLVKHASLAANASVVYAQIFGFLGIGRPWARLSSAHGERAVLASSRNTQLKPSGTHRAIVYRGGTSGRTRYAQYLPRPASVRVCEMMRSSPPVAALFLQGGTAADCSNSEGHTRTAQLGIGGCVA